MRIALAGRRPDGRAHVRRAARRGPRGVRLLFVAGTANANLVSVHAHTNNNLWGPQIGGLVDYGHQDVWLRIEGKAAICNNSFDRDLEANVNGVERHPSPPRVLGHRDGQRYQCDHSVVPHRGLDGENRLPGPVVRPVGPGGGETLPPT